MSLTKKNYEAIAEIIKRNTSQTNSIAKLTADLIIRDLSDYFQSDNPNFQPKLFKKACGLNED